MTKTSAATVATEAEFLTVPEAEAFARQSDRTLRRLANQGRDVGRRCIARRVTYHRPTLREFLLSQGRPTAA